MRTTSSSSRKGSSAPETCPTDGSRRVARRNHTKLIEDAKKAARTALYLKGLELVPCMTRIPPPGHPFYKLSPSARQIWRAGWESGELRGPWIKSRTSESGNASTRVPAFSSTVKPKMKRLPKMLAPNEVTPPVFANANSITADLANETPSRATTRATTIPPAFSQKLLPRPEQLEDGQVVSFRDATVYVQKIGGGATVCHFEYHDQ